ncbi:PorV/PorQ family protein [candidate division KSB1 bacterium]|nr:PorV/PorQ family protein [candidate division KSB1 bacterium]
MKKKLFTVVSEKLGSDNIATILVTWLLHPVKKLGVAAVLFFSIFSVNGISAQTSTIRNPMFVGARPMAMGETFVGIADDANAIYWNPAGTARIERYEFHFMHADLFNTGIANNYFAALLPGFLFLPDSRIFTFGFDWFNLGYEDDALDFSQHDLSFSAGILLHRWISIGAKFKYLTSSASLENIVQGKASGIGMDAAALLCPGDHFRIGVVVHDVNDTRLNYKNGVRETAFPMNIRYGCCYQFNDFWLFHNPLIALDFDDRIHLGAEIWLKNALALRGGIQKDQFEHGENESIFSFGVGVRYKFFQADYAFTSSPFLENTNRFSLSFNFNLPESPVKIRSVGVRDIYASQFIRHETDTCAVVEVVCNGDKPAVCKIEFEETKFGIRSEKIFKIDPGIESAKSIVLYPNLPNEILHASQHDGSWTSAKITLKPKTVLGTRKEEEMSPPFLVYGAGTINWSHGTDAAAAFITIRDNLVEQVTARAQDFFNNNPQSILINKNVTLAALTFNMVGKYGIRYRIDPNTPFAKHERELDTIQYPGELLLKKQGDCDDTTILFAALLENLGIRTALIDVPKHIFLMFDTGIHERQRLKLCLPEEMYVIYDNHVWLPLETTLYGQPFREALNKGAAQINSFENSEQLRIVDVHAAWLRYRPLKRANADTTLKLPDWRDIAGEYDPECRAFKRLQHEFLEINYHAPLRENPDDLTRINELAYILHLIGDTRGAQQMYKKIFDNFKKP